MAARSNRKARGSSKKKGNTVSVDFTGVESRVLLPEGTYRLRVAEVTQEEGDKAPYLSWKYEVAEGKLEGQSVYNNTSLAPQSLWNLQANLVALGMDVPSDELDLDLEELVGMEMMGEIEHETYNDKKRSRLVDYYPADGEAGDVDEDEGEKPKSKRRGKKDEADEDETPKTRSRRRGKKEEPEEEEEDKPKGKAGRSKGGSKKSKEKLTQDEVGNMDEDELEGLVDEHDLDVDLDDFKTLRKKRGAVIDALEEADLIEED